ncbi:MAG TPA: GIY-YIG nuclease family protein [Gemmatimonadaceae bacterium]|jgi:putative endonuclease|nr:GIY-YIG nuclease family protein [Gemmatimonadaceae bacterium]
MRQFYVYILASRSRRLYVGVTNNLLVRLAQHRDGQCAFTARYRISRLVYFECTANVMGAIAREKQIKAWRRAKRVALVESSNPTWDDLAAEWLPETPTKADPSSLRSSG